MRYIFPKTFLWGVASSACQIEAACDTDGKVQNVFDYYARIYPEKFFNSLPDEEADFYHKFPEDIRLMKKLGVKVFRFSISWARIFQDVDSPVNQKGVDYYNQVIDCLVENGIEPFFDLYHCDLPMFIIEKGGPKNPLFPMWFERYARTCFSAFGDRVKFWSTVNEPSINIYGAYATGGAPPFESDIKGGLQACHNMLLAHFQAVRAYREMGLDGKIGAVNHFEPVYPGSDNPKDVKAAERRMAFYSGWWLEPMSFGRYPSIITELPYIAEHMPEGYVKQLYEAFVPMDFLGINYYGPGYARHIDDGKLCYDSFIPDDISIDDYGFPCYPEGIYDAMFYLKEHYGDPEIYITENGVSRKHKEDPVADLDDSYRIDYFTPHLRQLSRCIADGVKVKGYCCWTILDTYEAHAGGYQHAFGLIRVDPNTLERNPRKSFYFYQKVIAENGLE